MPKGFPDGAGSGGSSLGGGGALGGLGSSSDALAMQQYSNSAPLFGANAGAPTSDGSLYGASKSGQAPKPKGTVVMPPIPTLPGIGENHQAAEQIPPGLVQQMMENSRQAQQKLSGR